MTRPRLVCIVGPTASGKTALALELAERIGAEVVSADSRQVYRRLDIGTAKPTAAERARVPHHCLDLVDPDQGFDAARFCAAANVAIADIASRGRVPLVVGGTGLWLRALLRGLCPAPAAIPALRAELETLAAREGEGALHERLSAADPRAAARLHPHDHVRIVRALEVVMASGRTLSAWQAEHRFAELAYEALVVGLAVSPEVLAARIEQRVDAMVAAGWVEEVAGLVAGGVGDDAAAWRTVGYRELRAVVRGESALAAAVAAIGRATRRFAGRQRTWFRREPGLVWRTPDAGEGALLSEVREFLGSGRA